MHIDKAQENHKYYRKIINSYIAQNKEAFKHFFEINPDESEQEYNKRYDIYIKISGLEFSYTGDFEI